MNHFLSALLCSVVLLSHHPSRGQTFYDPSPLTVRIGEALPESFYDEIHHAVDTSTGKDTAVKLSDYRDKLIILDFWANWCKPCIGSLIKLDSISRKLDDDRFVVLAVTQQPREMIEPVLDRFHWELLSIVSDTMLSQIFPHAGLPHQVWIKDGKVFAVPKWHFATAENILKTLSGERPYMLSNIQDLALDPLRPMFKGTNGATGLWFEHKYARIARNVPDYRVESVKYVLKGDTTILYCNAQPIEQLFYQAYEKQIFPHLGWEDGQGLIWQISDSLREKLFGNRPQLLASNTPQDDSAYLAWRDANLYGYELRYPERLAEKEARYFMQQDLNAFFGTYLGLNAKIGPGPKHRYGVLCLLGTKAEALHLLTKGLDEDRKADTSEYHFKNARYHTQFVLSMVGVAAWHAKDGGFTAPVVDSTGIDGNTVVSIHFPKAMRTGWTLARINRELKRYGMYIRPEERNVPVVYITERKGIKDLLSTY
ncbi:hypothetical protein GCM10011386_44930 [Parapedobacter defluvii]|uniref:Thioredoxin domain-containing protein n=1 Tax=Parapedobacter defluvii TaxID=2045106 RepID=A0ABQ1MWI8_9SPHI|nr:TlpA disulfide reductase family protein [Parapedobacter defluvii]GGC47797.1 hypothetical protein GCM10011386_44930 [Parapedobacter defluvii]